ncbi:hypothetical protein NDU88_001186 [Pleurodeles waltl]|uniref:Uncharacterized protein n=1 Tax=Pleurodeles waltl TaxID=8319 RepID=A0AAV7P3D0_PLEWA|nr:hypothetical protein NDU88_001186 [Pleurodeles waltl]
MQQSQLVTPAHVLAGSWNIFLSVMLWGDSPVALAYGGAIFLALYIPALMVGSVILCPVISVPLVPPARVATAAQLKMKFLGSPAQCRASTLSCLPHAASRALVTPLLRTNVTLLVSPSARIELSTAVISLWKPSAVSQLGACSVLFVSASFCGLRAHAVPRSCPSHVGHPQHLYCPYAERLFLCRCAVASLTSRLPT